MKNLTVKTILSLSIFGIACSEPMDAFNEVNKFRVLSVKADPPSLAEGETSEISSLLYVPEESAEQVSYNWSWCPIAAIDGKCLLSEDVFKKLAEELIRQNGNDQAADALSDFPISFSLGTNPTASFLYALPAQFLTQVCNELVSQEGFPKQIQLNCEDKLDVIIIFEATLGEETVSAVKNIPLYLDSARADNENPIIENIVVSDSTGKNLTLDDELPSVFRGETYNIEASVKESESQVFFNKDSKDELREFLFITWYAEGGEFEYMRTTYLYEEVSINTLRNNSWYVPKKADFPNNEIGLFLVLQDDRGGVSWLERRFAVKER